MAKEKDTPQPEPASAPPVPSRVAASLDNPSADQTAPEDPAIDKAIDEITAKEADDVLAAEDAELNKASESNKESTGWRTKVSNFFKAWWRNPKARYGTIIGLAVLIMVSMSVPTSRYFVMNTVGIRSSASVVVIDESTQQPLKNVEVTVANQTAKTDSNGEVKLKKVKLGKTELVISRRAFAGVSKPVTVGWGSNPFGSFSLKPTGSQYNFTITDFMSDKPIAKAEVSAGENNAVADDDGKAVLTVDEKEISPLEVIIKAEGYRDEVISLNLDEKNPQTSKLVPGRKHSFVSKRSGKFDLYSIDVDGKNQKVILAGTGNEREDMAIVAHPKDDVVAFSSTRDNVRNAEGYLLTTLNIVNTKTGEKVMVTQSESIQLVDWVGNRLIFVQVAAGASAANPNRMRIVSYDMANNSQKEVVSGNSIYDVVVIGSNIYFGLPETTAGGLIGFFRSPADGSNRTTILNKAIYGALRTSYDHISLQASDGWYDYKVGDNAATRLGGEPSNQRNRIYQDDENHKNSIWVENRDGKGTLLRYDVAAQEDAVLHTQSGLNYPVYWLNSNYVIYRVQTQQETVDYVLNLGGGQPRKISDVTNTSSNASRYY